MKKENVTGYLFPTVLFILSVISNVYTDKLRKILDSMDMGNFISICCLVGAGVSISYSYYLRIKKKVIAIKVFRDLESVRMANHYNAIIKSYENAFNDIQKKYNVWEDAAPQKSPVDEKNEAEDRKHQIAEILEYNEAFKDWGIGNYGVSQIAQTFYKTKEYGK